jgi:hypothetical protein
MGVKNLAELYSGDEFHLKIGEFFSRRLYFFLHVLELYSNLLFYSLLMKVQKNQLVIGAKVR